MIQRYNGIEPDDEGVYVLLEAHLAIDRDRLELIEAYRKDLAALEAAVKDDERWMREILEDYRIPYDNHSVGRRIALNTFIYGLQTQIAALTTERDNLKEKREIWEERNVSLETKYACLTVENKRLREGREVLSDEIKGLRHIIDSDALKQRKEADHEAT